MPTADWGHNPPGVAMVLTGFSKFLCTAISLAESYLAPRVSCITICVSEQQRVQWGFQGGLQLRLAVYFIFPIKGEAGDS